MTMPSESNSNDVSRKRLWFGFTSGAIAWSIAGTFDAIVAWHTCSGRALGSTPVFTQTGLRILLGVITFALLAITTAAGVISYKVWRQLSASSDFLSAEAYGRKQYMAMSGVLISAALGIGIVWFSIPIYILGACVRAR